MFFCDKKWDSSFSLNHVYKIYKSESVTALIRGTHQVVLGTFLKSWASPVWRLRVCNGWLYFSVRGVRWDRSFCGWDARLARVPVPGVTWKHHWLLEYSDELWFVTWLNNHHYRLFFVPGWWSPCKDMEGLKVSLLPVSKAKQTKMWRFNKQGTELFVCVKYSSSLFIAKRVSSSVLSRTRRATLSPPSHFSIISRRERYQRAHLNFLETANERGIYVTYWTPGGGSGKTFLAPDGIEGLGGESF
jgi:hypothetical protein